MFESFSKAVLFGLGAAVASTEKLRKMVDELVQRGEVTAEEGKKLLKEAAAYAEQHKADIAGKVGDHVRGSLKDLGLADHAQIANLENRIKELEKKLGKLEGARPAAGSKKGA